MRHDLEVEVVFCCQLVDAFTHALTGAGTMSMLAVLLAGPVAGCDRRTVCTLLLLPQHYSSLSRQTVCFNCLSVTVAVGCSMVT